MMLNTRSVNNQGAGLVSPDGSYYSNIEVHFELVKPSGIPTDAWDGITEERVSGKKIVRTNRNGEFSVDLWPTSRSTEPVVYLCTVKAPNFRPFTSPLPEGVGSFSWIELMLRGEPLSIVQLDALSTYRAELDLLTLTLAQHISGASGGAAGEVDASGAFLVMNRFSEIANNPAAQTVAQNNLGLGGTDPLAYYILAKA